MGGNILFTEATLSNKMDLKSKINLKGSSNSASFLNLYVYEGAKQKRLIKIFSASAIFLELHYFNFNTNSASTNS